MLSITWIIEGASKGERHSKPKLSMYLKIFNTFFEKQSRGLAEQGQEEEEENEQH